MNDDPLKFYREFVANLMRSAGVDSRALEDLARSTREVLGPHTEAHRFAQETLMPTADVLHYAREVAGLSGPSQEMFRLAKDAAGLRHLEDVVRSLRTEVVDLRSSTAVTPALESFWKQNQELQALLDGVVGRVPALEPHSLLVSKAMHEAALALGRAGLLQRDIRASEGVIQSLEARVTAVSEASATLSVKRHPQIEAALFEAAGLAAAEASAISADAVRRATQIGDEADATLPGPELVDLAPLSYPELNASVIERQELLAAAERHTQDVPSRRIIAAGVRVVQLLETINTTRKASKAEEIFRPTTRAMVAAARLSSIVAVDRDGLQAAVEALYMLLYEGAGTDSLRLLTKNGGVLSDDDCAALWRLKHLRLFFDHDMDHGDAKKRDKQWGDLGKDLEQMGFPRFPSTRDEFQRLHEKILRDLEELLQIVVSRL
jgi:hypothetical protein